MINDNIPRAKLYPIIMEKELPTITAHEYLVGVYRGTIIPNNARLRAAIAAIPYEKPKLIGVIADPKGDLADRLNHALTASRASRASRLLEALDTMPVIDQSPATPDTVEQSSAPTSDSDLSAPFPSDHKSRFRKL